MGEETDPSSHITEVWNIHMARTGDATAIMMNNEPKQKEAGEAGGGLSDVNLLINNVICKDIDVRRPIIRAAHRSYCHKPSSDCALEWKMSSMI